MEIYLSRFAGFCDGVRRAYDMASALDMKKAKKPVFILGPLVHNSDVIGKIEEKGIVEIRSKRFFACQPGEIGTLIITAHGVGPDVFKAAKKKKIEVINTTCPKVVKAQRLTRIYHRRGYGIVLVGDKGHKEVEGINEWGEKKAQIVSSEADLAKLKFKKNEKIAVLAQTTQSRKFFKKVADFIKNKFSGSEIMSTICSATRERQEEIEKLAKICEAVVVIGSKTSANSTRLYEIARSLNPKVCFVKGARELSEEWLRKVKKVAVTAGASTPDWVIEEVTKKIRELH